MGERVAAMAVEVGERVVVVWEDHDDWSLPVFRVCREGG